MATNISSLQQRIDSIHADFADGGMTVPERDAAILNLRVHYSDIRLGGGDVGPHTFSALVQQSKQKAKKV